MADRRSVRTDGAPAAIGPYSQAIVAGGLVFVSGQIPIDPASGAIVPGDAGAQTAQVMKNLSAILTAAGTSLGRAVKATVYMTDLGEFDRMNGAYAAAFEGEPPARATVQVAALPKGARVEIDVIALAGG